MLLGCVAAVGVVSVVFLGSCFFGFAFEAIATQPEHEGPEEEEGRGAGEDDEGFEERLVAARKVAAFGEGVAPTATDGQIEPPQPERSENADD